MLNVRFLNIRSSNSSLFVFPWVTVSDCQSGANTDSRKPWFVSHKPPQPAGGNYHKVHSCSQTPVKLRLSCCLVILIRTDLSQSWSKRHSEKTLWCSRTDLWPVCQTGLEDNWAKRSLLKSEEEEGKLWKKKQKC